MGGLDLNSSNSGCARLGGGVASPLGVVKEDFRISGIKGAQASGIAPVSKEYGKFHSLREFVFLSRAIDETDSPSYVAQAGHREPHVP